jgi:glucosyl-3-phosphoglycerate synthase
MHRIVHELGSSGISAKLIVVLNGASEAEARADFGLLRELAPDVDVLWVESEAARTLIDQVEHCFAVRPNGGKGLACWLGLGYLLHCTNSQAVALQDADVESFTVDMPARLFLPVIHPRREFDIAKAYYARVGDRLYGRLTRQFFSPFVHALRSLFPDSAFTALLSELRYPLSGEVAVSRDFAWKCRIPSGWSIEIGTIWDIQSAGLLSRMCQVDIADDYRHRHHPIASDDPNQQTLQSMATEIGADLLSMLAREGNLLTPWQQKAFLARYDQCAHSLQRAYCQDAILNGLDWLEHDEESAVKEFRAAVEMAIRRFRGNPVLGLTLPPWGSVTQMLPCASRMLIEACSVPGAMSCAA